MPIMFIVIGVVEILAGIIHPFSWLLVIVGLLMFLLAYLTRNDP